jgi:ferrochelatase
MSRVAVVLFNLGGPDRLESVRPFLFNLFNDKAIIAAPQPIRWAIARLISTTREKTAQANYAMMGGASPLLKETEVQARALEGALEARLGGQGPNAKGPRTELSSAEVPGAEVPCTEVKVFIAMRYWRPFTADAARAVAAFNPDEVVLLPLYPQFSTTTTGSSLEAWRKAYRGPGVTRAICCYPEEDGFVEAHARSIRATHRALGAPEPLRVLFSAHGLPQTVIDGGDPYQDQIERTCAAVVARLGPLWAGDWDWRVCYQSRVGPMAWLGPSTPEALAEAAADGRGALVVPIAFVSEHVETLVELDHEYSALAKALGLPFYLRAPAIGVDVAFMEGLAEQVVDSLSRQGTAPEGRACPAAFGKCPHRRDLRVAA